MYERRGTAFKLEGRLSAAPGGGVWLHQPKEQRMISVNDALRELRGRMIRITVETIDVQPGEPERRG